MRKLFSFAAIVLSVMLIIVSCAPENVKSDNTDKAQVYFGKLIAKAINTDVYDVSGSASFGTAQVDTGIIDNFYWAYTAVKKDDYFKFGEQTTFASVVTGAGLDKTFSFSKGEWEFTLRAFASAEDRTAGTPVIYEGTQTVNVTSDANINIPMSYCYENGTGTVNFDISVSISQEELSSISDYEITKVRAVAGDLTTDLTANSTKANWAGSIANVPNGLVNVSYEVYVANETEPRASASKTVIVMTNLETDVKGTATISLTGAKAIVSFNTSAPDGQPDETKVPPSVGIILELGTVPADNTYSNAGDSMKWRVIEVDKENGKALLMSVDPVTFRNPGFSNGTSYFKWSQTSLFRWLNSTAEDGFIKTFGLENVSIIPITRQTTPDSSMEGYITDMTTESTDEFVSVLSTDEFSSLGINANSLYQTGCLGAVALDGGQRSASYSVGLYVSRNLKRSQSSWGPAGFGLSTFPVFWLNYGGDASETIQNQKMIIFDLNGGSMTDSKTSVICSPGETISLGTPSLTGDTFVGWRVKDSSDTSTFTGSYTVTDNVTLVAVYEKVDVYAGETIELGSYNGSPVEYIVLDVDTTNFRALVTSKDCVAKTTYGSEYKWETSNINAWLNSNADTGFVKMFGLSNVSMASVEHTTTWDDSTETTSEKVFILSTEEMQSTKYNEYIDMTTANLLITSADSASAGLTATTTVYDGMCYSFTRNFGGQRGSLSSTIMKNLLDSPLEQPVSFNAAFWMNLGGGSSN